MSGPTAERFRALLKDLNGKTPIQASRPLPRILSLLNQAPQVGPHLIIPSETARPQPDTSCQADSEDNDDQVPVIVPQSAKWSSAWLSAEVLVSEKSIEVHMLEIGG